MVSKVPEKKIKESEKTKNAVFDSLNKSIPIWMTVILMLNSSLGVGFIEYYIMRQNMSSAITQLAQTTNNPNQLIQILQQEVLPQTGYQLGVTWQDIGQQLLQSGVIDEQKYKQNFAQDPNSMKMMKYLDTSSRDHMMINATNGQFMVDTLWALGLVNKNSILDGDNSAMKTYGKGDVMQFASTGGWSLGTKATSDLYSSTPIIQLTDQQQALVEKIAANIYRPCCGNPTMFPDCNHGMAVLGYIELAVKQGLSEKRIYQDVLHLNEFWFPQQYVTLAAYLKQQNKDYTKMDPKILLSQQYSSGQAMQQIQQATQSVPGLNQQGGGGCAQ